MNKFKSLIVSSVFIFSLLAVTPLMAVVQGNDSNAVSNTPSVCTMEYAPVCGVDGRTYSNKCMAGEIGIAHNDACKDTKSTPTLTVDGQTLERIPSPEQIKNFRVMRNENGTLYGVRLQANNQIKESTQGNLNTGKTIITANGTLERIPSPDQIKNFRVMKNENGALYGVRLRAVNGSEEREYEIKERAEAPAPVVTRVLEKIPAPQFISQYENIRRADNALWGYKKTNNTELKLAPNNRLIGSDIKACVAKVIDEKDEALKSRLTILSDGLSALISERNACQKSAIESEDNQRENLKKCVRDFQVKHKELLSTSREYQQDAWKSYQVGLKSCLPVGDSSDEDLIIEDGGSSYLETSLSQ